MKNKGRFRDQRNLSMVELFSELPHFIVLLVSGILSSTVIIWVDALQSFGYMLQKGIVLFLTFFLQKDLRYSYNYGSGKIETLGTFFCDGIMLFGSIVIAALSVHELASPVSASPVLIGVVIFKILDVILAATFVWRQGKILRKDGGKLARQNYASGWMYLIQDSVLLCAMLSIWIFRNNPISGYVSPVLSIVIAICFSVGCIKRLRNALFELLDKTLPEEEQLKILKVLNRHYNSFAAFHFVKSRRLGAHTQIDLGLSFREDTPFCQVLELRQILQEELSEVIEDCVIHIVIHEDSTDNITVRP